MHNGSPRRKGERENREGRIFEWIMDKHFNNLMKGINPQVQETQRTSRRIKSKRSVGQIKIKLSKDQCKERLLKAGREKQFVIRKDSQYQPISPHKP